KRRSVEHHRRSARRNRPCARSSSDEERMGSGWLTVQAFRGALRRAAAERKRSRTPVTRLGNTLLLWKRISFLSGRRRLTHSLLPFDETCSHVVAVIRSTKAAASRRTPKTW